jgi:hypothetical protein
MWQVEDRECGAEVEVRKDSDSEMEDEPWRYAALTQRWRTEIG